MMNSTMLNAMRTHYSNFLKGGGFARMAKKSHGPTRRRMEISKKANIRKQRFIKQHLSARMLKGGS